ncbi:MAG: hypothetical protein HQL35_01840 [Alphaproteobacteria bacterium]|nr:hypothetical protein [Alphaproteobacteria bacterium]
MTLRQRIASVLKSVLLLIVVVLASAELFSMISVKAGLIKAPAPSYAPPGTQPFRQDLDPNFGLWHPPHARMGHVASCFNVTYESNSYGARDVERVRDGSPERTVVLGDSFVEGVGLAREDRFTERLEAALGREHLNFGIANAGPTHYLQVYRHLAREFAHDRVIVAVLPNNDFRDDDFELGRTAFADRYRPYFVRGETGAWTLIHFDKANLGTGGNSDEEVRKHRRRAMRQWLTNFSYAKNVWNYVGGLMKQDAFGMIDMHGAFRSVYDERPPSGFYDYGPEDLARLEHVLDLLDRESGERPVSVVLLPLLLDFNRFRAEGTAPLSKALQAFASTRPDLDVVDLLPVFAAQDDPASFYLECDGHWNARGAELAARSLLKDVYGKGD